MLFEVSDLFKQLINCSGDESGIVLIRNQILEESILMLLGFYVLGNCILPVTTEHGVCLSRACLSVCENCEVVAFWHSGEVLPKMLEDIALCLIFGDGLVELSFDDRDRVSCDFYGFSLT